ncbi:MAG: hypothetical protein IH845_02220 [Nanoarchaeota archaeon]|nr:hypothetical protein [Nanoarchaeota archaeon]
MNKCRMAIIYLPKIGARGQAWGMDLMVATMIFTLALISFYLFSFNLNTGDKDQLDSLSFDGRIITNTLLSSGFPTDWTEFNVVEIGILTDDKIDESKLEKFYNFSRDNYSMTKAAFNTKYDYYFFLDNNMTINSVNVDGIGKPGVNRYNISATNLIKIERVVVYKNSPVGARLYIWN